VRVALKLTTFILALLIGVLALEGWLRVQHEREVFEQDIEHEQRLLGHALRPSIELAWGSEGRAEAEAILGRAQQGESEVRIRLVRVDAVGAEAPLHREAARAAIGAGAEANLIDRSSSPGVVFTYVPVTSPDGEGTAIELSESLAVAEERLDASVIRVFLTALAIVIGAGILALALGDRIVGGPVRRMVQLAGRIASGDLSPPAAPGRRWDELGQLKLAINSMVAGLADARDRAERETDARLEAEREMRRSERLVAVGTLAAGVAHELGTPLQIVSGRARMIEDEPQASETSKRNARIVHEQASRMERIVRQLLSLERPARVVRSPITMSSVAQETVDLLSPTAKKASVELEVIEDDPGRVRGDRDHLGQLVTNLVQNAIQALEDGGHVWVRISRTGSVDPPSDELGGAGSYVCLEVADDGPGIPKELEGQLFDPFFTTKEIGSGTGLGLSVAHGIAMDHEGWIEVGGPREDLEHGAVFRVMLPADEDSN
jgi:signal transduction histidine kinase